MRAMVVFESMFGNTEQIANVVADGLQAHMKVDVVEVGAAPSVIDDDVTMLVVGAPTHAFGLSRPRTRTDAASRSEHGTVSSRIGLREWLAALHPHHGLLAATFDTRADKPRLPGSAAAGAAKRLRRAGARLVVAPISFYVGDMTGPLLDTEEQRARMWADKLADAATGKGR